MRKVISLLPALFLALAIISCEDSESSSNTSSLEQSSKPAAVMRANPLPDFSSAEKSLHSKISDLASNRMKADFNSMTDQQREDYAVKYLKEDSYQVLKENGYTEEQLSREFKSDLEILHKALYFYSLKTNLNK